MTVVKGRRFGPRGGRRKTGGRESESSKYKKKKKGKKDYRAQRMRGKGHHGQKERQQRVGGSWTLANSKKKKQNKALAKNPIRTVGPNPPEIPKESEEKRNQNSMTTRIPVGKSK